MATAVVYSYCLQLLFTVESCSTNRHLHVFVCVHCAAAVVVQATNRGAIVVSTIVYRYVKGHEQKPQHFHLLEERLHILPTPQT